MPLNPGFLIFKNNDYEINISVKLSGSLWMKDVSSMDFAQAHDTLTITEWILRAIVVFIFLLIVAKFLGQRAISQLRLLDFVIALVIGNIIAHPLSDDHLNLKGSMTTTIVLAVLYIGGIFLNLKFPWFRKLVNHAPITLIQDGKIIYKALKKARISIDVLLEELRQEKVSDLKKGGLSDLGSRWKNICFYRP